MNEVIAEFEGTGKNLGTTRWTQFTDGKRGDKEMLERLDEHVELWLNPSCLCEAARLFCEVDVDWPGKRLPFVSKP